MARPIVKYLDPISGEYEFATVVDVGDLRDLNTTIKSDIVGAINSIISDGVHNPINDEKIEDLERIINSLKDGTFNIEDFGSIDEYLKQQFLDELDKINEKNREEIQSVLTQLDTSVDDAIKDYQEKVAAQNIILENAENTLADARGTLEAKAAELETANIGFSELKTEFDELDNYISTSVRTIDFDNFNAMVEDYETVVTQTSTEVGADMSGSTLSYLTGRVTDAEANISAQAGEISSKMGYNEFQYMPVPKYDYGENLLFDTFDFGDAWNGKNGAQVTPDTFLFGKVVAFNSPTGLYETLTDDLTIGESYVFSTYVNVQPSEKSPSQDRYEPISKSYDPTDFKIQIGGKSFNPGVYEDLSGINGWVRINQEFVADAVNPIISITPTGVNSQSEVAYMAMPKVEKGLTVTPWQPHVEDNYATLSSTQSMIKQQANSITAFVTGVEELDESYKQATSTFQMLADGFKANTEAVEAYEDAVTRYGTEYSNINGKFEQRVWKDDFDAAIEDINIDNRNRVLNSDFIRNEISSSDRKLIVEDWSLNSDWEIKTIDDNKYLSRSRTGLTQNLITSASSNYFPVRDGERTLFGFDLIHSGLDNDKVFAIELFDINDKRLLKQEFSLSSLTKVGNRYHDSFSISTPGVQKGRVVLQLPRNGSVSFTKISFQNADIGSIDWSPAPEDSWIIQSKLATYISQVEDEITIGGTGQKIDTLTGLLTEDKGTFTLNPDKIATEVLNSQTYDDMGFVNKTNFEQTADGWMQEITSEGRLAGYINASPDTYRISFDKIMLEGTTWADVLGSSKITVTDNFSLIGQNGKPVLSVSNDGSINMNVTALKIGEYNALTIDDKSDIEKEVTDNVIKTTEPYVHIAYADTEDGQGLSFNPSGKQYIGFAKSHLPTPSGTASNYEWSKYVGDAGKDGVVGKDGVGLIGTNINYATSTSGTIRPNDWGDEVPTTQPGDYLWTKTTWYYSDNTSENGYSVSRIGKDGNTGKDGLAGKDGVGIKSTVIDYATSSSGTVKPTSGWDSTVPSVSPGNYLWTRTVWTYTDNDIEEGYSVSRIGKDGKQGPQGPQGIQGPSGSNGQSQYVHIRYSDNSNGSGMEPNPSSTTKYVGIAVTNLATAPAYTGFTWSKYVGEDGSQGPQGVPGKNGANGTTTYTWVKYADTPTGEMSNFPEGKKYIGLAFNKITQTESDNNSDYQWSLMPQNIDIGGRNYLLDSQYLEASAGVTNHTVKVGNNGYIEINSTAVGGYISNLGFNKSQALFNSNVEVGETYTVSFAVRSLDGASSTIDYYDNNAFSYNRMEGEMSDKFSRFHVTGVKVNNLFSMHMRFNDVGKFEIKEAKLEKGNTATDWSPAPEDVEAAYTAVAQAKAEAEREIAKSYADGKVTAEEKARIKDADAKLAAAKKYAVDQILADKTIQDTRNDNQTPAWYYTNHPRRTIKEFKFTSTIGVVSSEGTYGILETEIPWNDASGGPVKQTFRVNSKTFKRSGTTTSWSSWISYDDIAETAKSIADSAKASASTANSLLTDIASDSKLTATEKKAAKKEWDIIVGEKPKIDSSANTYGITTEKTAYNTAYNTLNNYLSGLLSNLNTTSNIVGATFRSNFRAYYNARQDLLNKIADGAKSLVDGIEIGGENLFSITNTVDGYESSGNITTSTAVHRTMSNLVNIGDTKSLIYQIWNPNKIINTANVNRVAFFTEANVHISSLAIPKVDGSTYQMFKIDVPTNARKARLGAIMGTGTVDPLIKIKFEKGNKATDWSPAPEDIKADYTAVAQAKADAERIKAQSYADGKVTAEEKKRIADAEDKYRKALILARASSGRLMNSDPSFSKNIEEFNVYDNSRSGNVLIRYEDLASSTGPSGVTRRLRVTTNGTASPTWGGIVPNPAFQSRANAEYVIRFTALLPKGRSFYHANNAMGSGVTAEWLTSRDGTGTWEEYVYYYKCGSTGSFSNFGHLYVRDGSTPTTDNPLIWYLDKYEALDISNVTGNPSQEDVDGKASAEDLINAENGLSTSIGDLSNIVDGKVDKSMYEEFLEHNANIQEQLSTSTANAQEDITKALARTATVEQKLGEGAADWIFTHTKIRMSDDGITLGSEGSGSYLQITNDQISFYNGSKDPVAFINGGMLNINHAIFVESIQISEFMFSSEAPGHLTLRYVGN